MNISDLKGVVDDMLDPYFTKKLMTTDQKPVKKTEELFVDFPLTGYRGTAELKIGGTVAWSLYRGSEGWSFNSDLIE